MGTLILGCKLMRKCRPKTVPAHVISLAEQCEKGILYNWSQFLCEDFMDNVREVQEMGKQFCYSWLLFFIALVAWETLDDAVLPEIEPGVCKGGVLLKLMGLIKRPASQRKKNLLGNF